MQRWLIVGSGDVARRMVSVMRGPQRVFVLCREHSSAALWRSLGAIPLLGDLDEPASLRRLSGLAQTVFHFAPPPPNTLGDPRTGNLIAALERGGSLPQHLIYISTTGVYGDCQGASIDETRPIRPNSARARRRANAEQRLRVFGTRTGCKVSILRAPGIYAEDRLPLGRLQQGGFVPEQSADPWTNHIHAVDLARAAMSAALRGRPNRVYNVVDDTHLKLGDYYEHLAHHFGLPLPQRLPMAAIKQQVSEVNWSFMGESRQIRNTRVKHELNLVWRYPTVCDLLDALSADPAFGSKVK
ncbi:MAG: NAD-dependent epimerase/dehydratase family protein [Betaproteobacteria bacterium]|nr:NAD-dependent epimerase/dehydratase family protein [Betaproteobacteria bacterium]